MTRNCPDLPEGVTTSVNDRFTIVDGTKGSVVTLVKDMKDELKSAKLKHQVVVDLYNSCKEE